MRQPQEKNKKACEMPCMQLAVAGWDSFMSCPMSHSWQTRASQKSYFYSIKSFRYQNLVFLIWMKSQLVSTSLKLQFDKFRSFSLTFGPRTGNLGDASTPSRFWSDFEVNLPVQPHFLCFDSYHRAPRQSMQTKFLSENKFEKLNFKMYIEPVPKISEHLVTKIG